MRLIPWKALYTNPTSIHNISPSIEALLAKYMYVMISNNARACLQGRSQWRQTTPHTKNGKREKGKRKLKGGKGKGEEKAENLKGEEERKGKENARKIKGREREGREKSRKRKSERNKQKII